MANDIPRRTFLRSLGAGLLSGGVAQRILAADSAASTQPSRVDVGSIKDLPTRPLGRTGFQVPPLSFGSAPMGHMFYKAEPFEEVTNAAIDAGLRYIDTALNYDAAQERLGPIMAKRRKEVFLVSKTRAKNRDQVFQDLEKSLKLLQTDHVDLLHMHNMGDLEREQALGKGGVLEGMLEAKRRGLIRNIGISGHLRPERFVPAIETDEIDVIMVAMNFVDRHTYNFEEKVLPAARKENCGIVCMKVYGGAKGGFGAYRHGAPGMLTGDEYRQSAVDYSLSIPGVATMVIGVKTLDELRAAIAAVRNHKPLEGSRRETVLAKGAELAKEWGPHFG
jgi:uncharacterized protein